MYRLVSLSGLPELIHGISTKDEGNMSLLWGAEAEVTANRNRFLAGLGLNYKQFVAASLEAGTEIVEVGAAEMGKKITGDALVTRELNVPLWMLTADCFPVIFFEPAAKILALVHCGRRGVDGELPQKVVERIGRLGGEPQRLVVGIGPGIGKKSYTWEGELPFKKSGGWELFVEKKDGIWYLGVEDYLTNQLLNAGVKKGNISRSGIDVFTDNNFCSHIRSIKTGEP